MTETAEVVVLGLGPGGEAVAGDLAEAGLDVVAVEGQLVGGECPYWGCIPSKRMARAADALAEARRVPAIAGRVEVTASWEPVARWVSDATDGWDNRVAVERLEGKGARLVRGWGRLDGRRTVVVGDRRFEASRAVVIGTGARPWVPPIDGLAKTPYWSNREAIETTELPASLVVLGGGAIGAELAQVFARFGSEVTVVETAPRILAGEEPETSALIQDALADDGIAVRTAVVVERVSVSGARFSLTLGDGSGVGADHLLVATGRRPDLGAIGAGSIGIDESARGLPVDERLRVTEGVWAVGDATGVGAFTHVAVYQARLAVADILGRPAEPADYRALPRVTFTDPEVGGVGLTESAARDRGLRLRVGSTDLASSSRGFTYGPGNAGLIKLVEDADRGVLVGATSVGPSGGEVLGLLALAVHAGVPTSTLGQMIPAFPTFHRAISDALADLHDAER